MPKVKEIIEKGKVIKDSSVAEQLLPVTTGCFFGGTDYDQFYYDDLELTKKILTEALKDPMSKGEFYYHSSW